MTYRFYLEWAFVAESAAGTCLSLTALTWASLCHTIELATGYVDSPFFQIQTNINNFSFKQITYETRADCKLRLLHHGRADGGGRRGRHGRMNVLRVLLVASR